MTADPLPAEALPADVPPASSDLVLAPATRLLWRTHNSLHLELGGRAVIIDRLPRPVIERVTSNAPAPPVTSTPARRPTLDPHTERALADLAAEGYLWPRPQAIDDLRRRPPTPRLTGELIALTARVGEQAATVLSARTRASVVLHGHPRMATHLAAVLAASGVGRVHPAFHGYSGLSLCAPGGLMPTDEGADLARVALAAVSRAAPEVDTAPLKVDERPDLTVLVLEGPYDEERRAALHADGAAHLVVTTSPDGGVVGPLVVPGLTSCLRCADLHRQDRDPSWSVLAAQLSVPKRHGASCDVASVSIISGVAAAQALAFLDGVRPGGDPLNPLSGDHVTCVDGTLELHPPDWRLRRRSWPAHPGCGCGGAGAAGWAQ